MTASKNQLKTYSWNFIIKYTDDYKGIKYTPYSSYYDDETCEDYDKEIKSDEID